MRSAEPATNYSEIQYENDPSTSVTEKSPRVRNRISPTYVTNFVTESVVTDNLESELSSTRIREIEILRDCNLPELSYIRAELRLPATAISTGSRRAELDLELSSG